MKKILYLLTSLLLTVLTAFGQDAVVNRTAEAGYPSAIFEWNQSLVRLKKTNALDNVYTFQIQSPVTFTGMGVGWETATRSEKAMDFIIEFRVRKNGGEWTEWLSNTGDIGPEETETGLYWSDVMIAGDGSPHNEFEVRIKTPATSNLRRVKILASDMSADDSKNAKQNGEMAPMTIPCPTQPTVVMRSEWWGNLPVNKMTYTPTYHTITHVFVHHTAGSNNYTNGYVAIRQTWDFHVNGRGWLDIGYNYLFDKFGHIFQGRHNPQFPNQDVRGAHAGHNNNGTIGVSFMGDFMNMLPNSTHLNAGTSFLAWYFKMRNLDPLQTAVKNTKTLPRLTTHRDGYLESTDCPGNTFYAYQPTLRQNIKNIIDQCGNTCNTPTGLSVTNLTATSVTMQWNSVAGATGYNVQYRPIGANTWITGNTTNTNLSALGLTSNTPYEFQVQAVCGLGTSLFSPSFNFTTSNSCATTTGLLANNITITGATLNWNAVSGATSYTVQYRKVNTTTWTTVTVTGPSIAITGLTHTTNYEWQVMTNCSNSSSAYTALSNFTTLAACGLATGLTATNITTTSATLQWNAVANVSMYQVSYKPQNITTWTAMTVTTNTLTLNNLLPGTVYEWKMRTVCNNSAVSQTGIFTFTTASLCNTVPSGLTASSVSTTTATVSWNVVSGAVSYDLRYKPTLGSIWTTIAAISATNKSLTGLSASTAYEFQVLTNCSNGSSAFSSSTNFTTQGLCWDANESNNSSTTATSLPVGVVKYGKICPNGDADWFKVNLSATSNLRVTLSHLPADFDLDLYIGGNFTDVSHNGGTVDDVIIRNNQAAGALHFRVYSLGPVNDQLDYQIIAETSGSAFKSGDFTSNGLSDGKSMVTFYPNPTAGNINFTTTLAGNAPIKLELFNLAGEKVGEYSFESSGIEQETFGVDASGFANGLYIAKVSIGTTINAQKILIQR